MGDKMNNDMKEIVSAAEQKGYKLVKFDEFSHKDDKMLKTRHSLIFEEVPKKEGD